VCVFSVRGEERAETVLGFSTINSSFIVVAGENQHSACWAKLGKGIFSDAEGRKGTCPGGAEGREPP